ncbi:MAG: DNA repair protein RecN [Deltaproteobacteria bacterium]|nr:DNA repair protein RecN [Deltaproteobacteria bacterium]
MLLELNIGDFAIIDDLNIAFTPGLNVFTGETGAGKSIIIGAIELVLGDRASVEMVRSGKEEARVEAFFDIKGAKPVSRILDESGLPKYEQVLIRRVINKNGRNKVMVNDSLSTIVTLSEIGRRLIDIYGQSEHQSLTRVEEHIDMLDLFGSLANLRAEMSDSYRKFAAAQKTYDSMMEGINKDAADMDLLRFQSKELSDAALKSGEEEELKKERGLLVNSEKLITLVGGAEGALYSSNESILSALGNIVKSIKSAAKLDARLIQTGDRLDTLIIELEDCASFLRDYVSRLEADPDRLDKLESRLALIEKLRKKYSAQTIDDLLEKQKTVEARLSSIDTNDEKLKEAGKALERAKEECAVIADSLSEARRKQAAALKTSIEKELSELGMKGAIFEASIETDRNEDQSPRFGEKGADRVIFLISTNPGEDVKPLSKVASGGELSRIMLAMKAVTALGKVPTLIFDEVDTGVGAPMAQVVGKKLKAVSKKHQVICITHMPQIAAFADTHFYVSKTQTKDGRTVTRVKKLDDKERIEQVAVMLGGAKPTDATIKAAKELFASAAK